MQCLTTLVNYNSLSWVAVGGAGGAGAAAIGKAYTNDFLLTGGPLALSGVHSSGVGIDLVCCCFNTADRCWLV
jgi:hypothetical protein